MLFLTKKDFEIAVSKQSMAVCEEIVTELGAEIHDDLIQRLTILRLSIDRLETTLNGAPDADRVLATIKAEYLAVIDSVRRTSQILLPTYLEEDSFSSNIRTLCQTLERPGAGNIQLTISGDELPLDRQSRVYLNRIVQEIIHNAFKHSAAWHVWVNLIWSARELTIRVEDDGSGFSKIPVFVGLLRSKWNTLRMRCRAINADIEFKQGSNGLIVQVVYPLKTGK